MPTRFKYAKVEKESFGLEGAEILLADDAQLNALVSLKKIAPYRRKTLMQRDMEKYSRSKKKKLRDFRTTLIQQIEGSEEEGEEGAQSYGKNFDALGVPKSKVKKVMKRWIKGVKRKRLEGVTEADLVAKSAKERKQRRLERATDFKQQKKKKKGQDIDAKTEKKGSADAGGVSQDRRKTYGL